MHDTTDQNIAQLLQRAYAPEQPDAAFVARVREQMLETTASTANPATNERTPLTSVRLRLSWVLGMAALLALIFIPLQSLLKAPTSQSSREGVLAEKPGFQFLTARPRLPQREFPRLGLGESVQTKAGDRRRYALSDGSVLCLNQNTRVHVSGVRRVQLEGGEVYVEVAPQSRGHRPFVVETPRREVAALGTRFAVSADQAGTGVAVTQGQVRVTGVEDPLAAGQQLLSGKDEPVPAPRASHLLDWTRELMRLAESPLVPASQYAGGALVAIDPDGQEAKLALRNYHVDVHIEAGFARTTIDQTYFNHHHGRLEGTFYFPLPADASLSRLAMYVADGDVARLNEGGMAERDHARNVYETIVHSQRDPALLEWVDGSTFKMRVFPLEARQEKRLILSYTQRLESLYGQARYRFPAGHSLPIVRDWSFTARIKHGATCAWNSDHPDLKSARDGADLLLAAEAHAVKPDRDVEFSMSDSRLAMEDSARFATTEHDGNKYLMLRYRPALPIGNRQSAIGNPSRHWVFLCETSGDRDPLLARAQIDIIRAFLGNAEHDDSFALVAAGTRVRTFPAARADANGTAPPALRVTPENVQAGIDFLENIQLIGALDLGQALAVVGETINQSPLTTHHSPLTHLIHVGTGIAAMGERREDVLAQRLPRGVRYVGVGVGKRWARGFMKAAAERSAGYFTQINPNEPLSWRAFEIYATLNTPRLLNVQVTDSSRQTPSAVTDGTRSVPATFLCENSSLVHGEELCAMARIDDAGFPLPESVVVTGLLDGLPYRREIKVDNVAERADYLPRTWAKLEIDRLLAEDSVKNKDRIVALSKAMYVMSPFTSLLVLENEAMYQQYKVDRGRKDHWAMYRCPDSIPVVTEPDAANPAALVRRGVGGRTAEQVMGTIVVRKGMNWWGGEGSGDRQRVPDKININTLFDSDLDLFESDDPVEAGSLGYYRPTRALTFRSTSRIHTRLGGGLLPSSDSNDGVVFTYPEGGTINVGNRIQSFRSFGVTGPGTDFPVNSSNEVETDFFIPLSLDDLRWRRPDVHYEISERPAQRVGQIIIAGNEVTRQNVILRQIPVYPGQVLSYPDLRVAENNLKRLNIFDMKPVTGLRPPQGASFPQMLANQMLGGQPAGTPVGWTAWHIGGQQVATPDPLTYLPNLENDEIGLDPTVRTNYKVDRLASVRVPAPISWRVSGGVLANDRSSARMRELLNTSENLAQSDYQLWSTRLPSGRAPERVYGGIERRPANVIGAFRPDHFVAGITPAGAFTHDLDIPLPDEPPIQFPTSAKWRQLIALRSDRYREARMAKDSGHGWNWSDVAPLYRRPTPTIDDRLFYDLVSYAPGMNTSGADIRAVLEAEVKPRADGAAGKIDPRAKKLIDKARAAGWRTLTNAGTEITFDGSGRYVWERVLPLGLRERVVCDGVTLWHLYPELCIGARRTVSRFHRAEMAALLPWVVPPVEDLARAADLTCDGDDTVVIAPPDPRSSEGKAPPYLCTHLIFADGRLAERRIVLMPEKKVLQRVTYAKDGTVAMFDADGQEVARQTFSLREATAPELAPDTKDLAVLPLPLRSLESAREALKVKPEQRIEDLDTDTALALFTAAWAAQNQDEAVRIFGHLHARGQRSLGFYTLLAASGINLDPDVLFLNVAVEAREADDLARAVHAPPRFASVLDAHPRAPLARYLAFMSNPQERQRAHRGVIGGPRAGFIQKLADFRLLYQRWQKGQADRGNEAERRAEQEQALAFIRREPTSVMSWALLGMLRDAGDTRAALAEAHRPFEGVPGLGYATRYERARHFLHADRVVEARKLFEELYRQTLAAGVLPPIDGSFREALGDTWHELMRETSRTLLADNNRPAVFALAWQCRQLHNAALAEELVDKARQDVIGLRQRLFTTLAAVEFHRDGGDPARALELLQPLLADVKLTRLPSLWRLAYILAGKRENKEEVVPYLEKALALEFEMLPEVIDLRGIRNDYEPLLAHYQRMAEAMATLKVAAPPEFTARVVGMADRWRAIDREHSSDICRSAARILKLAGERDLAWDYLTTPLALRPNESDPWLGLARELGGEGDWRLADRAYAAAFDAEPTNAQILWDRAQHLDSAGARDEARVLYRRLAAGSWQPRFRWVQERARENSRD